jgi:hypothetical protein
MEHRPQRPTVHAARYRGVVATSGPMTEIERYTFDLQGFLVRRGVLTDESLAELNIAVDALRLPPPDHTIGRQRFAGHLGAAAFRELMDHDGVLPIVQELCGATVRMDHAYGIVMSPGTSGLTLHGGPVPFDPSQYFTVQHGRMHCGLVAAQWALVDHWPGQGGFCCIPGSHKSSYGVPREIELDHPLVREIPMRAGDVVIFTEALVHATMPWQGTQQRRTLLYKYSPGSSSWAIEPAADAATVGTMTPRQKRLCQPPSIAGHEPV